MAIMDIKEQIKRITGKPLGKITIGDVRHEMATELYKGLEKAVDMNKEKNEFYLLVAANSVYQNIKTTIMVLEGKPPTKLLGTMLFYVNNKLGIFRKEWILPKDAPKATGFLTNDEPDISIVKDAQGLPIF